MQDCVSKPDLPLELRVSLLRQHGNFSQAYSAVYQPALDYFGDHRGFLAYKMVGRTAMVLADPIAPAERFADLITEFLNEFSDAVFCQSSHPTAEILAAKGFMVNEMGLETKLDLTDYTFDGYAKQHLRRANNRVVKLKCTIKESSFAEVDPAQIKLVSDKWRENRTLNTHTLSFLVRPIVLDDEPDVRKFFLFDEAGRLVAFEFFDPVYEGGRVIGYMDQFRRRLPEADPKVNYAISYRAIETFRNEGRQWMFIGLSPFAAIGDPEFRCNRFVRRSFKNIYNSPLFNRLVYPLQGHAFHKSRYGGNSEQTFYAFNKGPSLFRMIKLMRACNIIPL